MCGDATSLEAELTFMASFVQLLLLIEVRARPWPAVGARLPSAFAEGNLCSMAAYPHVRSDLEGATSKSTLFDVIMFVYLCSDTIFGNDVVDSQLVVVYTVGSSGSVWYLSHLPQSGVIGPVARRWVSIFSIRHPSISRHLSLYRYIV